jgi:hypothetical protein
MGEKIIHREFCYECLKEGDNLKDMTVDGRITLI